MADGRDGQTQASSGGEQLLAALAELKAVLSRCAERSAHLVAQIDTAVEEHAAGQSWRAIAEANEGPLLVEQVTNAVNEVIDATAAVRRAGMQQLLDEGMSQKQIASSFNVTHQRVSQLVNELRAARK